jgi:hypothetical protein
MAFSYLLPDGTRLAVWATYFPTAHHKTDHPAPLAEFYDGARGDKLPGGWENVDPDTIVKEVEIEFVAQWNLDEAWEKRYGPVEPGERKKKEIGKDEKKTDEKRKRGDQDDTTSRKRACSEKHPPQLSDGPNYTPAWIAAYCMLDDELFEKFNNYNEPISDAILYRISGIAMHRMKTKTRPPLALLQKIQDNGNCINPWHSRAWCEWVESNRSSREQEKTEQEKIEPEKFDPEKVEDNATDTETHPALMSRHARAREVIRLLDKLRVGRPLRDYA